MEQITTEYNGLQCTCTDDCEVPCKGECGCECHEEAYQDYLSKPDS